MSSRVAAQMHAEVLAVGRNLPRLDAMEKATGRAKYIADMALPGMLSGAILTSPLAHAKIVHYDIAAALAAPGVNAVVTGEDCPDALMGPLIKDEHAIAKGKVRYIGEPVAAVAAENEQQARAAALLIEVEYEELPAALTPEEALTPGAPIIHEALESYFKGSRASLLNAVSVVRLAEREAGLTEVSYTSNISITGRFGKFGLGIMRKKADQLRQEFVQKFGATVAEAASA